MSTFHAVSKGAIALTFATLLIGVIAVVDYVGSRDSQLALVSFLYATLCICFGMMYNLAVQCHRIAQDLSELRSLIETTTRQPDSKS